MNSKKEVETWDKIITAKHNLFNLNLKDVYRYKDLIRMFIKRDFVIQYKQTVLGPLWYLIQPIISSIMYMFIFGRLANIGTDGIPFLLFYYSGNMLWMYFTSCLLTTSAVFTTNQSVFSKVFFPRLVVPVSTLFGQMIKLGIQFVLLLFFYAYYFFKGVIPNPSFFMLLSPFVVLWIGMLGIGLGLIISSLTTKYRDLNVLLNFGIQLMMYATPVVYPLSEISEKFRFLLFINPMSAPMELFRIIFFRAGSLPVEMLFSSLLVTLGILFLGLILFSKNEKVFVDVI